MKPASLVTIICANELEARLAADLKSLGITGYTMARVSGRGVHGPRKIDMIDRGNVRIEVLVPSTKAEEIVAYLEKTYGDDALTGYVLSVGAFPNKHVG